MQKLESDIYYILQWYMHKHAKENFFFVGGGPFY